jgi:hypothetical protein
MTTTTAAGTTPRPGARGAKAPLPPGNAPFTTVIAGTVTEPKIPPLVGDSWRPTAASVLGVAPLAAVAAMSAMSLMGTASAAPTRPADASTAHTTMTSGSTESHSGARGAETPLLLADAPFTTVIAASMTDTKLPPYKGD